MNTPKNTSTAPEYPEIKTVAIVGLGALGLLYGEKILAAVGNDNLVFPMDSERLLRHKSDSYTINGKPVRFHLIDAKEGTPVDLLIVAVKEPAFEKALVTMRPFIDEHTIVISVMNGITTENLLRKAYPDCTVLPCVAIGMDAMREGSALHYVNYGKLQTGITDEKERPAHKALTDLLSKAGIPFTIEPDILHTMWRKFMINVGINQSSTVFDSSYSGILNTPEQRASFERAMREVMVLSDAEGIHLTEEDFRAACDLMETMDPGSFPSMHQDYTAKRPTEVELFAGTVRKLAQAHRIPVPENDFYYERIRALEKAY